MLWIAFIILILSQQLSSVPIASVLVMRHCSRAPARNWQCVGNGYSTDPNKYSSRPWPTFPVPEYECTPRGLEIIKHQSINWNASLRTPIEIIADNVDRDRDSAKEIAKALGVPNIQVDGSIFNSQCPPLDSSQKDKAIKEQLRIIPIPPDYKGLMEQMQKILGTEPPIDDIPNTVQDGDFNGGICVAGEAVEFFLFELGAGLEVAWGELSTENLYKLLALHVYYFDVHGPYSLAVNTASNLLYTIMIKLRDAIYGNGAATTFLLGHDSNLESLAELLNLAWHSPPYPINSTTPGSALRFDVSNKYGKLVLDITFISTPLHENDGHLTVTPVLIGGKNTSEMMFEMFEAKVNEVVDQNCIKKQ